MPAYDSGIEVTFGFTTKRYNSTNQEFEQHFKCNVRLKEPCSIVHPTFILSRNAVEQIKSPVNFAEINYCRCAHFMRYYWISDVIYGKNDIVEIHCDCDVLATWHDHIKLMDGYMLYCSHKDLANTSLDDNRLQPEQPIITNQVPVFDPEYGEGENKHKYWDVNPENWTYIMETTIMADHGSINVNWVLNKENFEKLADGLLWYMQGYDNGSYWNWDNFAYYLKTAFGGQANVQDFIHNIRLMPIPYDSYENALYTGPIFIGAIEFNGQQGSLDPTHPGTIDPDKGVYGKMYSTNAINGLYAPVTLPVPADGPIPKGSLLPGGGETNVVAPFFLRGSRFCKWGLKHPGGVLWFETNQLCSKTLKYEVGVNMVLDSITGDYTLEVWCPYTKDLLGSTSGSIAVNIGDLFNAGGRSEIMSNAFTSIATKGLSAFETLINAKVNPTVTTTKSSYANTRELIGDNYNRSTESGTKETETTAPAQLNLGVFGGFFPGRYSIETGSCCNNASNGFINAVNAAKSYEASSAGAPPKPVVKNEYMWSIIGVAQVPAIFSYDEYEDWAALHGYPYSKMINIKDDKIPVGSYCQFSCATIGMSTDLGHCMMPEEASQINTFLNSGFFYEGPGEGEGGDEEG